MQTIFRDMPLKIKAVQCRVDGVECIIINEKWKRFKNEIEKEFTHH